MRRSDERHASTRNARWLVRCAVALLSTLALVLGLGSAASAAPTASLTPTFEGAMLGEPATVTDTLKLTGTEYHGEPLPISELTLRLPKGTILSNSGFPTCPKSELEPTGLGPSRCVFASSSWVVGSFTGFVAFGGEYLEEHGSAEVFFAPEGGVFLFLFGHAPVLIELLAHGEYLPAEGTEGPGIKFKLPQVETVPSAPHMSLTALTVPLGAFHEGHTNVTAPSECSGHLSWGASVKLSDGEGAEATAAPEATSGCLAAGKRTASAARLEALTPVYEEQADGLFAFVSGEPHGEVPTGHVAFHTDGFFSSCYYGELVESGLGPGIAETACEVFTSEAGSTTFEARYAGDPNFAPSEAKPLTVTVLQGTAAEHEAETKANEEAKRKAEEALAAKHKAEAEAAQQAAALAAAKKAAEETARKQEQAFALFAATLPRALRPHGKTAKIAQLLKHGSYSLTLALPSGSTLTVDWYELPKGARLTARKPVLIAAGNVTATDGATKLTMRLTPAGKALLRHSRSTTLTARATLAGHGRDLVKRETFKLVR
jgi:hypothetical protein